MQNNTMPLRRFTSPHPPETGILSFFTEPVALARLSCIAWSITVFMQIHGLYFVLRRPDSIVPPTRRAYCIFTPCSLSSYRCFITVLQYKPSRIVVCQTHTTPHSSQHMCSSTSRFASKPLIVTPPKKPLRF
jgi:hypothetical protein